MKRVWVLVITLITLFAATAVPTAAAEDAPAPTRLALIETDTGPIGSSINYFVLRPVMEYDDKTGISQGTMFTGVIFSLHTPPKSTAEAEGFITALLKDGTCLSAANTVAGEMKEDGYLEKDAKYPVYAAIPYTGGLFTDDSSRLKFCRYYLDTLYTMFAGKEYKHISLAGVYLSAEYDANPTLRGNCISLAKNKGLESVVSTAIGGDTGANTVFAANAKLSTQLEMGQGISLSLGGVPTDGDVGYYNQLSSDFKTLKQNAICGKPILFTFAAYNNIYDCASAIEATLPNEKGRATYELVKEIIDCSFSQGSASSDNSAAESKGRVATGVEYVVYAALALVGTAGFCHLVYALFKKGKPNGTN